MVRSPICVVSMKPHCLNSFRNECQSQVHGYSGAKFKSFGSHAEAAAFVANEGGGGGGAGYSSSSSSNSASAAPAVPAPPSFSSARDRPRRRRSDGCVHSGPAATPPPAASSHCSADSAVVSPYGGYDEPVENVTKKRKVVSESAPTPVAATQPRITPNGDRYHVAYTDGACRGNGTPNAIGGAGAVVFDPSGTQTLKLSEKLPSNSRQTNQRAEIYAAVRLLGPSGCLPVNSPPSILPSCLPSSAFSYSHRGGCSRRAP